MGWDVDGGQGMLRRPRVVLCFISHHVRERTVVGSVFTDLEMTASESSRVSGTATMPTFGYEWVHDEATNLRCSSLVSYMCYE